MQAKTHRPLELFPGVEAGCARHSQLPHQECYYYLNRSAGRLDNRPVPKNAPSGPETHDAGVGQLDCVVVCTELTAVMASGS